MKFKQHKDRKSFSKWGLICIKAHISTLEYIKATASNSKGQFGSIMFEMPNIKHKRSLRQYK